VKTLYNYNNWTKVQSRQRNLEDYRRLSGRYSLPSGQVYATLSSRQLPNPDSEIFQMIESGLIQPEQFVGIDKSATIIAANRKTFPRSIWIAGRWKSIFEKIDIPVGMAYLDSCYVGDSPYLLEDILAVMRQSRPGTFLFVNAITGSRGQWAMSRPGKPIDDDFIPKAVASALRRQDLGKWDFTTEGHIYRNSNGNYMLTRVFIRES